MCSVTLGDTAVEDRDEVASSADRFREGRRNSVLVLFSSSGRGAVHVALTDDLVKAGKKAGDLVNRIAKVSGGKGGGRPHFASASAGDPTKLSAGAGGGARAHRGLAGRMSAEPDAPSSSSAAGCRSVPRSVPLPSGSECWSTPQR